MTGPLRYEGAANGVVTLTLRDREGRRLPDWSPGAHVDVVLPTGAARQYSLCGDRWDATRYRIGVLREADGQGGSAYVHDVLALAGQAWLAAARRRLGHCILETPGHVIVNSSYRYASGAVYVYICAASTSGSR